MMMITMMVVMVVRAWKGQLPSVKCLLGTQFPLTKQQPYEENILIIFISQIRKQKVPGTPGRIYKTRQKK